MENGDREPTARLKVLERINVVLANIEEAKKRVHAAESELGTAKREWRKLEDEYTTLRNKLLEKLPSPDNPVMLKTTSTARFENGVQIGQ
jgi:hypothetical protein